MLPDEPNWGRVGFCAILGLPNAGKSTLLNCVLGTPLMAVSARPQTTRNRIIGVRHWEANETRGQIVYLDTPGVQRGQKLLNQFMLEQTKSALDDCDVALWVVDVERVLRRGTEGLPEFRDGIGLAGTRSLLALNKIDLLANRNQVLPAIERFAQKYEFEAVFPVSARSGDGVDALEAEIVKRLPVGSPLFPEDMTTDRAERFLAAELVREQLFRQLGQELPYACAVEIDSFKERTEQGDIVMDATIFVERTSQKGIVVGKGGQRIKSIGERARKRLAKLFDCPVHLRLFAKVAEDWTTKRQSLRALGYSA